MQLVTKTKQIRRDFTGLYRCENCGKDETIDGYDDRNFHDNVIPSWQCKNCGKSSNDLSTPTHFVRTIYPDHAVI